jgi:anhydro-N-acetylmuramic acid kinase
MNHQDEWKAQLQNVVNISLRDFKLLHAAFGHYMGAQAKGFISKYKPELSAHLIASKGYAVF